MSSIRERAESVLAAPELGLAWPVGAEPLPEVREVAKWIKDPDAAELARFVLRITAPETRELIARYLYTGGGYTPGEATGLADDLMSLICEGTP